MADGEKTPVDEQVAARSRRRTITWIVVAVLVILAIGTAIAFAMIPRDPSADPTPSGTSSPTSPVSPSESGSPSESASPGADAEASAAPITAPESEPFPEQPPVDPQEPGDADGIEASLVKFESVTGEVVGPGDVAAAAVRVTVDITNTGTSPLDLNLVVMNAYMGAERDPAETYEQPGGQPVNGSLDPGKTATGVYLFRIPEDRRDDVTFVLDYLAGQPAITFRGPIP